MALTIRPNRRRLGWGHARHPECPGRLGVALLVTVAALVVTVTAAAILVQLAVTARLQRRLSDHLQLADDLVLALAGPIEHWLANDSSHVVLPPDAGEPAVSILHDLLQLDGRAIELRVAAWDQCGMASMAAIASGSPLRLAMDDEMLRRIDDLNATSDAPLGLDLFIRDSEVAGRSSPVAVFPSVLATVDEPVVFVLGAEQPREPRGLFGQGEPNQLPAIGAMFSTHLRGGTRATINTNTAPMGLLEAAMRLAGRGGIDQIAAARGEGKPVRLAALSAPASSGDSQSIAPFLAASSDAWAFRIDIRIDGFRRSWWVVYVKQSSTWECIQRLAIPS